MAFTNVMYLSLSLLFIMSQNIGIIKRKNSIIQCKVWARPVIVNLFRLACHFSRNLLQFIFTEKYLNTTDVDQNFLIFFFVAPIPVATIINIIWIPMISTCGRSRVIMID